MINIAVVYSYIDAAYECLAHILLGHAAGSLIDNIFPYDENREKPLVSFLFVSLQIFLFIISLDAVKTAVSMLPTLLPGYSGLVSGAVLTSWATMSGLGGMTKRIKMLTALIEPKTMFG